MVTADSKSRKEKSRQANKAQTATFTLKANMAKSYHALADYQDAVEPIFFHHFDNIPIPEDNNKPRVYKVSTQELVQILMEHGLVDCGANGGICNGKDMRLMFYHLDDEHVNISRVGNHLINNRQLATFCAVIKTHLGRFLGIFHNYAYVPEQQGTIHSAIQLLDASNLVSDITTQLGGHSRMDTKDGYRIPLCFHHGLCYIQHQPPTDDEMVTLDHIIMTTPGHQDPSKYDDTHLSSSNLMKRIPTTLMDAMDDLYNCSGDIVETNFSDQQQKTISWDENVYVCDDNSLYTMPSLQYLMFNDDSSGDYSHSTNDNDGSMLILSSNPDDDSSSDGSFSVSIDDECDTNIFSQQPPQTLILNMEEFLSDDDDDADIEEVYNEFDNDGCSNTIQRLQAHLHDIDSTFLYEAQF